MNEGAKKSHKNSIVRQLKLLENFPICIIWKHIFPCYLNDKISIFVLFAQPYLKELFLWAFFAPSSTFYQILTIFCYCKSILEKIVLLTRHKMQYCSRKIFAGTILSSTNDESVYLYKEIIYINSKKYYVPVIFIFYLPRAKVYRKS